ncbi:hypothetical protein HYW21_01595 [Candidatus Woesearchaeota archaeon]|nr:hypothetical protein [Candidatus Woesearchaeota archaeon]
MQTATLDQFGQYVQAYQARAAKQESGVYLSSLESIRFDEAEGKGGSALIRELSEQGKLEAMLSMLPEESQGNFDARLAEFNEGYVPIVLPMQRLTRQRDDGDKVPLVYEVFSDVITVMQGLGLSVSHAYGFRSVALLKGRNQLSKYQDGLAGNLYHANFPENAVFDHTMTAFFWLTGFYDAAPRLKAGVDEQLSTQERLDERCRGYLQALPSSISVANLRSFVELGRVWSIPSLTNPNIETYRVFCEKIKGN